MFCTNCGVSLPEGSSICSGCGKAVSTAMPENAQAKASAPTAPDLLQPANQSLDKRKVHARGKVAALIVGVALFICAACVGGLYVIRANQQREQELQNARVEAETAQKAAQQAKIEAQNAIAEQKQALEKQEQAQNDAAQAKEFAEKASQSAAQAKADAEQARREAETAKASAAKQSTTQAGGTASYDAFWDRAYSVDYIATVASTDGLGAVLRIGPDSSYSRAREFNIADGTALSIAYETTSVKNSFWGYTAYDGVSGWVYLPELLT